MKPTIEELIQFAEENEQWAIDDNKPEIALKYSSTIDALRELQRLKEWRPIEEAPRDGSGVISYIPQIGTYFPIITISEWGDPGPRWYNERGGNSVPTHWLPLPQPPTESEAGDE